MNKKVYIAMSGGVDSSVAAALLKEQGYFVVGVFMKFWSPSENSFCLWKEERADAVRVAAKLDIPLLTWDFTHEYEKKVVAYMLAAYKSGVTPNPDIMCNKEIKFGMFFDKAIAEGADFVATGHYSRIAQEFSIFNFQFPNKSQNQNVQIPHIQSNVILSESEESSEAPNNSAIQQFNNRQLLQAVDKNKDQSYFLYTLEQRHLARTLFPIGEYTKPEVRELARRFDLPTAEKKDSQGVCFIGPLKMRSFLKNYIKPKQGKVFLSKTARRQDCKTARNSDNAVQLSSCPAVLLGSHDGAYYYTIGQRHGIDLKLDGGPYYVIGKDVKKNEVYVGKEEDLYSDKAEIADIHWVGEIPQMPAKIGVKIRYRSETINARIKNRGGKSLIHNSSFSIRFDNSVRAVTPGQAAVFYDGEKVLGGGIIK